jgi:hypothetical protein
VGEGGAHPARIRAHSWSSPWAWTVRLPAGRVPMPIPRPSLLDSSFARVVFRNAVRFALRGRWRRLEAAAKCLYGSSSPWVSKDDARDCETGSSRS